MGDSNGEHQEDVHIAKVQNPRGDDKTGCERGMNHVIAKSDGPGSYECEDAFDTKSRQVKRFSERSKLLSTILNMLYLRAQGAKELSCWQCS